MPFFVFRSAKALRDLEERLDKVERDLRPLLIDAEDLYEKTRRALGRMSKRAALADRDGESSGNGHDDPARPPNVDPKSWDIIRKRRGGIGPTNRG